MAKYRRNYKKKSKRSKKKYIKTYRRRGYTPYAKFGGLAIPDSIRTKHRIVYSYALNMTTGSIGTANFQYNGLHQPDGSSSRQPYMFDTYAALYNTYLVTGASFKYYLSTDSTVDILTTVRDSTTAPTIGDLNLEAERGAISRVVTNERPAYIKAYYPVHRTLGVTKSKIMMDDLYSSVNTTVPSQLAYVQHGAQPVDKASSAVLLVRCQITFYVKWSRKINQSASAV